MSEDEEREKHRQAGLKATDSKTPEQMKKAGEDASKRRKFFEEFRNIAKSLDSDEETNYRKIKKHFEDNVSWDWSEDYLRPQVYDATVNDMLRTSRWTKTPEPQFNVFFAVSGDRQRLVAYDPDKWGHWRLSRVGGKLTVVQSEDDPVKFKIAGSSAGRKFAEISDSIESAVAHAQANYQYVMLRFLLGKRTATIAEIGKELQRWNSDGGRARDFFEHVPVYGTAMMKKLTDEGETYDRNSSPSSFRFTLSEYDELDFVERHKLMKLCKEKIDKRQIEHNDGTIPYAYSDFVPLTDKQEIKEAHDKVVSALTAAYTKEKEFKAYQMNGKGYWLDEHGIFFYTADPATITENHYWDVFGTIEPSWDRKGLVNEYWILEINPPIENSWKPSGQFLKDEDGRIYYTHNGNINVPKSRDGSRFGDIYAGLGIRGGLLAPKKPRSPIIISDLESPDFVDDVADYVKQVQEFRNFVETQGYQDLGEEEPTEYWMIRAGSAGSDWENQRDRKIAAIHYYSLDLSKCTESDGTLSKDKVKESVYKIRKDRGDDELTSSEWGADYGELKRIFRVNRTGGKCRILVVGRNEDLLGIADATSQYEYKEGLPNPHAINVEWIETASEGAVKKLPESCWFMPRRSIKDLTKEQYDLIMSKSNAEENNGENGETVPDCSQWLDYMEILLRERNMIFYGPPGTGKTWTARQVAECWCKDNSSDIKDSIKSVTFHPSYSYEDFVEGFRPKTQSSAATLGTDGVVFPYHVEGQPIGGGSSSQYELAKGIFLDACDHASDNPGDKTILLIDEINRGNIPKIFGELITLIEKDKRESKYALSLTYSKKKIYEEGFWVPDNLYIIGTMNTADKSLIQMDDALKRRFAFEELLPDVDALKEHLEKENVADAEAYGDILYLINQRILNHKGSQSQRQFRDRQIGHSYFWNLGDDDDLKHVIKYKIIPLLQDYFFDDYGKMREVLRTDENEYAFIGKDSRPTDLVNDGFVILPDGTNKTLKQSLLEIPDNQD